ncbi:hypothetical protein [Synechococcus phage BUCT-ZZ01]|nr:hypothetical protein [Synechococcus phage BUCT-ZZ01]
MIANIFADESLYNALANQSNKDENRNLIKHMIFNCIRSYKKKFGAQYGNIVICCDGRRSWRKDEFEFYKANRKKARDESTIDFEMVFEVMNETLEDLKNFFPYPVIKLDCAEGDDVIAVIVRWGKDNLVSSQGLFEEPEHMMILSSDRDFVQLQKYPNVKQYSFTQKKEVVPEKSPKLDLLEKILTGDKGDGVPNICSAGNTFVTEGARQKPFKKVRFDDFAKAADPLDACLSDDEKKNFIRNQKLIDLDYIPENVYNLIVGELQSQLDKKPNKMNMMNYFISKGMKLLLQDIGDF